MNCKICSRSTTAWARACLLGRYDVQYFRCGNCGFIQTEEPFWLDEAYSQAITNSDLGLVNRNITCAAICKALIGLSFDSRAEFLDYGGGYGLFVRLMRDAGFRFLHYDKFSPNLFAQGFEATEGEKRYEMVTAIELFEHFAHPLEEIDRLLRFSRNIFFSTELVPPNEPEPGEWHYFGLEHGQHVAFYTPGALSIIADKFNLRLYSNGKSLHLVTEKNISRPLFRLIVHYKVARLFDLFTPAKSLLAEDTAKRDDRR